MLDHDRHAKLQEARKATRASMSVLVRVSVDRLMSEIGYPNQPDWHALTKLLDAAGES